MNLLLRAETSNRHPEVRAERASKGDGPGRSSFEALAALGRLRMTASLLRELQT